MGNWKDKCYWRISLSVLAAGYMLLASGATNGRTAPGGIAGNPGASNKEIKFFKGKIKFFEMERGCKGCPSAKRRKKQLPEEDKSGAEGIPQPETKPKISLTGFITLDSPYTTEAVKELIYFREAHPEVEVRGVVIMPLWNAKKALFDNMYIWKTEIPFALDFSLQRAKQYKISCVPTFVFEGENSACKVTGQPDLEKIYIESIIDKDL